MKKNETKKSVRRFYAGDVIQMEFTSKKKPCDIAMAMLLTPITVTDDCYTGCISTAWMIDVTNNEILPDGCMTNTTCHAEKVTGRKRAWFFKNILELCRKSCVMPNEMEVLVAYDDEDGSHQNIATMSDKDWKTGCKVERMKTFLMEHYSAWLDGCDDESRKEYEDEIAEAATRLSVGLPAECCGDDLHFETVTFI